MFYQEFLIKNSLPVVYVIYLFIFKWNQKSYSRTERDYKEFRNSIKKSFN